MVVALIVHTRRGNRVSPPFDGRALPAVGEGEGEGLDDAGDRNADVKASLENVVVLWALINTNSLEGILSGFCRFKKKVAIHSPSPTKDHNDA